MENQSLNNKKTWQEPKLTSLAISGGKSADTTEFGTFVHS
jgi:hypothetical protein